MMVSNWSIHDSLKAHFFTQRHFRKVPNSISFSTMNFQIDACQNTRCKWMNFEKFPKKSWWWRQIGTFNFNNFRKLETRFMNFSIQTCKTASKNWLVFKKFTDVEKKLQTFIKATFLYLMHLFGGTPLDWY